MRLRRRLLFPGAASVIKLRPPFKRGVVGPSRLAWGQRARTGAGADTLQPTGGASRCGQGTSDPSEPAVF